MRYTREELAEARRSIDSTLRKCEKALEKAATGHVAPHADGTAHPGVPDRLGADRPGDGRDGDSRSGRKEDL